MAFKRKFKITKTNDSEIVVEDMDKEEKEDQKQEVLDMGEGTYDAEEVKAAADMCKDMGYKSMADALEDLKERKSKDEKEDPDKKTDDEKKDETDEEKEEKKKTSDAALESLEKQFAQIKDVKVRDSLVKDLRKVKDGIKGYIDTGDDVAKKIFMAKSKDQKVTDKKQPEFANMDAVLGANNPHKK